MAALTLAAALTSLVFGAGAAVAEENGSFRLFQSFVRDYTVIEHVGETITGGSVEGTSTVLQSSGGPFVEEATHLMTCVTYAKTSETDVDIRGGCRLTDGSGDSWFALAERREGDLRDSGGGSGRWYIVGGTGKYAGISGSCSYETKYLPGVHIVSTKECTWTRS